MFANPALCPYAPPAASSRPTTAKMTIQHSHFFVDEVMDSPSMIKINRLGVL
jgi:hypothetical protein